MNRRLRASDRYGAHLQQQLQAASAETYLGGWVALPRWMASGDPVPGVEVLDRGVALGEDDSAAGTSSRIGRFLPGIHVLRHYRRAWLRGDVVAGCTVAAYLVPQVMAYAEVAGLPPVTGLWAVMGPLLVYAVLGSSRQLSVGPESTTALMTATALAALTAGGRCRGRLLRLWRLRSVQCAWSAGWLGWGFWLICCPIRF